MSTYFTDRNGTEPRIDQDGDLVLRFMEPGREPGEDYVESTLYVRSGTVLRIVELVRERREELADQVAVLDAVLSPEQPLDVEDERR